MTMYYFYSLRNLHSEIKTCAQMFLSSVSEVSKEGAKIYMEAKEERRKVKNNSMHINIEEVIGIITHFPSWEEYNSFPETVISTKVVKCTVEPSQELLQE